MSAAPPNCGSGADCGRHSLYLYGVGNIPQRSNSYSEPRPDSQAGDYNFNDYLEVDIRRSSNNAILTLYGVTGQHSFTLGSWQNGATYSVQVNLTNDKKYKLFVDNQLISSGDLNSQTLLSQFKVEFFNSNYSYPYYLLDNIRVVNTNNRCTLPVSTAGYNVSNCDSSSGAIYTSECSVTCDESNNYFQMGEIKRVCSVEGGNFAFSGCRTIGDTGAILQSRSLHLEAGRGVTRDNDNKVISWESVPDENGDSYVASQGAGGIDYINQSSYFNYLPTLSFNGTGHLINTDFDGLSSTNDFTRIIVLSHDLTGGSDNNVAFNDSVGGSVQYYSSGRLYSYSANGSNYARVDGTFNSANQYQPLILTHLLDSTGANNNAKVKVRINGETKSVTSFTGAPSKSHLEAPDLVFSHSGSSYRWKGDIAEVYLFDRRLSDVEIKKVEDYLKIKYGITKLCQSPNTPPEGYVYNSCNTDLENLAASECSISCAAGFSASRFFTPYVTCADTGEDFKFYGCYPDNENSRSPPSFVTSDHVGHWDTFNGINLNADGKVSSWTSYPIVSQSNATPSLSSANQLAIYEMNNEHFGNNPVIYFQVMTILKMTPFSSSSE